MEKSSFFNSVGGDRVYKAEEWAEYFASFIGNGVFPVPSNGLQVEANSSAGVIIRAGRAWINGYFYFNTDDLNVKLNTADGVLNRIDRIVIRWDLTARTISAEVKSSAPSNNPTTPALQRDADAYELCLADVYVRAGSTAVLQSDITDQRYNSGICGVVKGTVDQIDASMLAKQFNDYAELFKRETKLDFEAWFEEIRGILSEDLAGSLALAIDDINRSKGQPGGIATLNSSGKLAQMPTAADVGAMPSALTNIIYVDQADPIPHYDNLRNYTTPGQRVLVATATTAMSVDNCPEIAPGVMDVTEYNHDKNGNILGIMQRFTSQISGITYTCIHTTANGYWSSWKSPVACSDPSDGNIYISFSGGMHICAGSQTWSNVNIGTQTAANNYVSGDLYFSNFKKSFSYAPKCLISLSVGANGPYWIIPSPNGPTTQRPQGFRLGTTISTTISTVTLSYIAIGVS